VSTKGDTKRQPIKLRTENWNKIACFWKQVSQRYMLHFDRLPKEDIKSLIDEILKEDIFSVNPITIIQQSTEKDENETVKLVEKRIVRDTNTTIGQIAYCDFIKKLHKRTFIPVQILHEKIWEKFTCLAKSESVEEINKTINDFSLNRFVSVFQNKFVEIFATKYQYTSLNFNAETSVIKDGSFVAELERGLVGVNNANIAEDSRNLYDNPLSYDSELEHDILKIRPPDKVVVYGKLPKKAIKLPTYTGGTTTPDFIYAIKKDNSDEVALHFIVEIKSDNMRESDKIAVSAQQSFFKDHGLNIEWKMETNVTEFERDLIKLTRTL
jgi:type III restriction enzyme